MSNGLYKFCWKCNCYGCIHVNPDVQGPVEPNLGEKVGNSVGDNLVEEDMINSGGFANPAENDRVRAEFNEAERAKKRVLIKPGEKAKATSIPSPPALTPAKCKHNIGAEYCATCKGERTYAALQREEHYGPIDGRNLPAVNDNSASNIENFERCNICFINVNLDYLPTHMKLHLEDYKSKFFEKEKASSAIVPVSSSAGSSSSSIDVQRRIYDASRPKVNAKERFKFKQLTNACAFSSTSKNKRYSDFTVVLWGQERKSIFSGGHVGGQAWQTTYWDRITIHIVYDAKDDYYYLSTKACKRSEYGHDSEEGFAVVPDRICYQSELLGEIKRALIYNGFNPKRAYRLFRKCINQNLALHSQDGNIVTVNTESMKELDDKMKKNSSTSGSGNFYASMD